MRSLGKGLIAFEHVCRLALGCRGVTNCGWAQCSLKGGPALEQLQLCPQLPSKSSVPPPSPPPWLLWEAYPFAFSDLFGSSAACPNLFQLLSLMLGSKPGSCFSSHQPFPLDMENYRLCSHTNASHRTWFSTAVTRWMCDVMPKKHQNSLRCFL